MQNYNPNDSIYNFFNFLSDDKHGHIGNVWMSFKNTLGILLNSTPMEASNIYNNYVNNLPINIKNTKQLIKEPPENIEKLFEEIFNEIKRIKQYYQENNDEPLFIYENPAYILATLLWLNIWG